MAENPIADEATLEKLLSEPTEATRRVVTSLDGDIVVLGAGGKMGPTLAMMLKKADPAKTIYAVSRFSDGDVEKRIADAGIETISLDLLDESTYSQLPDAANVFYLAGMKFGASGNQPLTWAMNAYLPALAARHYRNSRIVAFSTGNVYPLVDATTAGPTEQTPPEPVGEYAQSCLGRERIFEHFSQTNGTEVAIIRLNYANEPRYGIIVDLTLKIFDNRPIDLAMGYVNLIFQGDANNYIIQAMSLARSPATVLNVTGGETISVRQLASRIADMLGKQPQFTSQEAPTALLSDASLCVKHFGPPPTSLEKMLQIIVPWVANDGKVFNKPTKYDVRDGKF